MLFKNKIAVSLKAEIAVYQSPLVVVTKRQRIAEQFALLRMLPGELWSEMEDVFEAEDFRKACQAAVGPWLMIPQAAFDHSPSITLYTTLCFHRYQATKLPTPVIQATPPSLLLLSDTHQALHLYYIPT